MAANFETSQNKGSDEIYDVCCSVCQEDSIHKEGLFHCQKCSKSFCNECVQMHNKILKDHLVSAKGKCDNFPVTNKVEETLELCEEHATEKLTMFCEDHEKLLCQLCLLHNHRQCSHVVLLAEKCKTSINPLNVADIATNMEQFQKRLLETMKRIEQNIKSLQTSCENILEKILDFRRQINESLDLLQQQTVNELDKLHSSLKNYLDNERKQCKTFISNLKVLNTNGIQSPAQAFVLLRKYLEHTAAAELFLRNVTTNSDIQFQPNKGLDKCLAACTNLGKITSHVGIASPQHVDPNKVINVQGNSEFKVETNTDICTCSINGICEMSNGNLVISDHSNLCVKLLDQAYNVIDQVKLTTPPWSMCNMSPDEVRVTVRDEKSRNEIHVLRVDNGKIIKIKTLKLNHVCYGIAHRKGDMLVTTGTSLLQYATDGRLVKKLYDDKTPKYKDTVEGVAVSPDGKRIYLTDRYWGRLVTLTMDGAVTATLQDNSFKLSWLTCNIHVAATGQVFVFGNNSLSQVDTDGKKILATVAVDACPSAVYFNIDRSKLLVGKLNNACMTEIKTRIS